TTQLPGCWLATASALALARRWARAAGASPGSGASSTRGAAELNGSRNRDSISARYREVEARIRSVMWENAASGRSSLLPSAPRDNVVGPLGLTATGLPLNILQLMSANVPELLDAWRMVAARRCFDGQVPLSDMTRLQGLVADTEGRCSYAMEFGRDDMQVAYVELT